MSGTCNENVNLIGTNSLNLGAWFGQTATINGQVYMEHTTQIYLCGLKVTNPYGDGIVANFSKNAIVDTCTSNGNGGYASGCV